MSHDLQAIMAQEPQPTITITCRKVPVAGQPGQFMLEPQLTMTHMPGGWESVYKMLGQCQYHVVLEMVKEAREQGDRRVMVVPGMPGELVRQ
jgi:hypothetical protein